MHKLWQNRWWRKLEKVILIYWEFWIIILGVRFGLMGNVLSVQIITFSTINKSAVKLLLNAKNSIEELEYVRNVILGMKYMMDHVCWKMWLLLLIEAAKSLLMENVQNALLVGITLSQVTANQSVIYVENGMQILAFALDATWATILKEANVYLILWEI